MNIPDELLPVIEWWERSGKTHLAYVAVAGVAALAAWGYMAHRASGRAEAAAALVASADVETLEAAVARHGGTPSTDALKLKLAAAYLMRADEGDAGKALAIYDEALASGNPAAAFDGVALAGRANSLEALERWPEAVEAYKKALDTLGDSSFLKASLRLGLARATAQAAGKEAAMAMLEEFKKNAVENKEDTASIDATIDLVKRWSKREPAAIPSSSATPAPAVPEAASAEPAPATPAEAKADGK